MSDPDLAVIRTKLDFGAASAEAVLVATFAVQHPELSPCTVC